MFDKFFNRDGVRVSQVDWSDAEAVRAAFLRRVLGWFFEPLADFPRDGHDAFPVLMATFTGLCAAERAVASGSAMMEIDESIDTTTSHQIYAACNYLIQHGSLTPPMHILNAPTKLMKELGYSKGYEYDHNAEDGFSGQNYFPDGMAREAFYQPVERGFEREILKRLEYWKKLRDKKR